ncbi:MAG: Ppx/GppA phosphatase family protein [Planctomycetota bacterium]|jgi:exopolyphosphatase/guanosine-5'-triphosphate,3'-diphosphate pyrophosphatase
MEPTDTPSKGEAAAKTVAAVDVGSNALRMVIAEVFPDGRIEILERLQQAARLGQDAFRRNRLGGQVMRAAVAILRDYKQLLELYRVERIRAVATTAVREAANADAFLDRVLMATGLKIEVIGTSEESRLTVSAVRQAVGSALGVDRSEALIADVGGGSTLLTVLDDGEIANSQSLRLGAIRLQEVLSTGGETPERSAELLRHHITKVVASTQGSLPLKNVQSFVAVGGDARFAARQIGKPTASADLYTVDVTDFDDLVVRCQRHSAEELGKRHGLPFAEAETLTPALLVYQNLLHHTHSRQMIVSRVSMRDGLLLELARNVTGEEDESLTEGILHSAMALAEKYRVDLGHSRNVADLSMRLFDELEADHGLGRRHRLLLQVAGLVHEVGAFVGAPAHHKHGYYLIRHAEIFGLDREEIEIVAHVARYHRRSAPKPSHVDYVSLPRETRMVVSKLAAILRVADALSRGPVHQARDLQFERREDDLIVHVLGADDLILEKRAMAVKGDLFEDIYGMRIRLEEA